MTRLVGMAGWIVAAIAIVAIAAWPFFVDRKVDVVHAQGLPTMAPVVADYVTRLKLIAFWERAVREHHQGDMLSPRMLADQYLQRYREDGDIGDVLRAQREAKLSLAAQPVGNLPAETEIAGVDLTLHRFHEAIAVTQHIESWDRGDDSLYPREASLQMEVGNYARAAHLLAAVPEKDHNDEWRVVESRYLELTGHLAQARDLLALVSAYQNGQFDVPAQQRAWYFFRQGEMAFEAGDNPTALADEREAVTVFPYYADGYRALARVECALHDWKNCLADASKSANEVPYPETLGYEADAQAALGDAAGAARTRDLILAVERIGNAYRISDRLLAVYYSDHRLYPADAYAIAKRELSARDDVFTEDTLAWAAAMDGRWSEARARERNALAYGTENALLYYHAGIIALHFGDRTEARRRLQMAVALNPAFHPVFGPRAKAMLASL
jgi:tetratricopeptide (TPR) repeat protein